MLILTGLLTPPPRSLFPPPVGLGSQANCQLVADDGSNWLLVDPSGLLSHATDQRVAVSGWSDGHGLLVTAAAPAPVPDLGPQPLTTGTGQLTLTGRLEPVIAAHEAAGLQHGQPRHCLTGPHGIVWLLAPATDLDGLSGNTIQATGWLLQPQHILVAEFVRILPRACSA